MGSLPLLSKVLLNSNEGQEIKLLHSMGYKFADNIQDLTPIQVQFLLESHRQDLEQQRQEYADLLGNSNGNKSTKPQSEPTNLKDLVKKRRNTSRT